MSYRNLADVLEELSEGRGWLISSAVGSLGMAAPGCN